MNQTEFFNWFHHSFLPVLQEPCKDFQSYHYMLDEVFMFLRRPGNGYSYKNYACILTAWLNETQFGRAGKMPLIKFVSELEASDENYWFDEIDHTGILPKKGIDYED